VSAAVTNVFPIAKREDFARRIRDRLRETVEAVIEVGKVVLEAKSLLAHGDFESMVRDDLGWSPRTAQRFMSIARHPVLSNATHVSCLPPSWGTLAELARVEPKHLEAAIASGMVRPDMKRTEVGRLVHHDARRKPARRMARREPPEHVKAPVAQRTNEQIVVALGEEARAVLIHLEWLLGQIAPSLEAGAFVEADEKKVPYDRQALDVLLTIAIAIEKHSNIAEARA
jgi:Protein of unknown function (DUF3102)